MNNHFRLKQKFSLLLIIISIIISSTPLYQAEEPEMKTTDISNLKFKQEISLPIDTSLMESKFQPIDLRIQFDQSCWANNDTINSVRVAMDDGTDLIELDSQIYDLSKTDDSHIDACSIVFLIPEEATGEEKYFVIYDDQQTEPAGYEDHLRIKDTHYFYEPISGQYMDFDYYQIWEDEYIAYGVCQQGELLGSGMSNAVIKLKSQSTEFKTTNAEQIASFSMSYSIDPAGEHTGTQWAKDVVKNVIVDGNLMIRFQIEGESPNGNIISDNIYTYYYCPGETKKIYVNVNHDVTENIEVKGTQEREGIYASLSTIKARSGTISDMNLGEILPNVHFFSEDETIKKYDIPTDPDADPAEWLLTSTDDEDLGTKAWFCMDDPDSGQVHGLIFDKITGYTDDSYDGIQMKTSVHQHVKLPGLEADTGDIFAIRNAYESGDHSTTLSSDLNISFNVVYIAAQMGGYEIVDSESTLYQELIQYQPINRGNVTIDDTVEQKERYSLTALVHLEPSVPLGSLLSAGLGRNITYLTAELYKNNDLASSGSAQRLQLGDVNIELEGLSFGEKISTVLGIFDMKNSSIFKKVKFPDLEEGTYLVKIYKENPLRGNERKYVGYEIVDVAEDTKTHIYCKSESHVELNIFDQDDNNLKDIQVSIQTEDIVLSDGATDESGFIHLSIPLYTNIPLRLVGEYQGFIVFEKDLSLGIMNKFRAVQDTISFNLHSLKVIVTDTLGLPPAIDPNVLVTSDDMIHPINIQGSFVQPGEFEFEKLFESKYHLKMSFKSFEVDETFDLSKDTTKEIVFPAEFDLDITLFDSYGLPLETATLKLNRENKGPSEKIQNGKATATVPPGTYELTIHMDNEDIASQDISVKGDRSSNIITTVSSGIHTTGSILLLLVGFIGFGFFFWKGKKHRAVHILIAMIILFAILQPWWMINGDSNGVTTQTKTLLYPSHMVTLTSTNSVMGGEVSEVTEDFTMVLQLISYILMLSALFVLLQIFIHKKIPKISLIISVLTVVFLLLSVLLFYVAMSEVTKIGIGGFSGSETLSISIPGQMEKVDVDCSWGASLGVFSTAFALLALLFVILRKRLIPIIRKFIPII